LQQVKLLELWHVFARSGTAIAQSSLSANHLTLQCRDLLK